MKRTCLLLVFLYAPALLLPASTRAAELWVGADGACNTSSLADAIATARSSPEADVIRLARNQPYENQAVRIDTSVDLVGGYPNCGAGERAGHTPIAGTGSRAVIVVDGGSGADGIDVRLEGLDVSGGGATREAAEWGGISIRGAARVRLSDSIVHHNDASLAWGYSDPLGSGLSIDGARASAVLEHGIRIHDNKAPTGGGIGVRGGTLRILPHDISIERNQAGAGGGIAVLDNGKAAIWADAGDPALPVTGVRIAGNVVAGDGGGILVSQAEWSADDVIVQGNHAQGLGSAIAVGYRAVARLARRPGPDARHCPPELDCLRLSGNGPNTTIRVDGGGLLVLDGVTMRENVSSTQPISVSGERSTLRISGSLVSNTSSNCYYHLARMQGGTFEFEHSTFARIGAECWGQPMIIGYASSGLDGTNVVGRASLVYGFPTILQPPKTSPLYSEHYDCVMKDGGAPESAAERSSIGPIRFVDAANGNFRLTADNEAIDYCDDSAPSSRALDLDRQPRGLDSEAHADRHGPYDLGAYEFGTLPDRLFSNGFDARR